MTSSQGKYRGKQGEARVERDDCELGALCSSNLSLDADKFRGPAKEKEARAWVRRPTKLAGQLGRYVSDSIVEVS